MTINLPSDPAISSYEPYLVSARSNLTPSFGGPEDRSNRMGSRWAIDVAIALTDYVGSLQWSDLDDESETLLLELPQPGLDTGSPGTPVVDGSSQSGSDLVLRGLNAGYVFQKGQFLSAITSGQRYLYRAKSDATANGLGQITIPIKPMMRVSPIDGDTVEIAQPMIEGFVNVKRGSGRVGEAALMRDISFTLKERA